VQRQTLDGVRLFADVYGRVVEQIGPGVELRQHPWFGVNNRDLQAFDADRLCAALSEWQKALELLASVASQARSVLDDSEATEASVELSELKDLLADLKRVPVPQGTKSLRRFPVYVGEIFRHWSGSLRFTVRLRQQRHSSARSRIHGCSRTGAGQ